MASADGGGDVAARAQALLLGSLCVGSVGVDWVLVEHDLMGSRAKTFFSSATGFQSLRRMYGNEKIVAATSVVLPVAPAAIHGLSSLQIPLLAAPGQASLR